MAWPGHFADRLIWLAALAIAMAVGTAGAEEPVLARVLAVEPSQVTLTVEGPGEEIAKPLIVPVREADLPPGVRVGALVRLWPGPMSEQEMSEQDSRLTAARLVPVDNDLTGRDRTGVRARLMYGAQRGFEGGIGGSRDGR